jgi:hypothetical protein
MPSRGSAQLLAETVPNAARLRAAARDEAVGVVTVVLAPLVCEGVDALVTSGERSDEPNAEGVVALGAVGADEDEADVDPAPAEVVFELGAAGAAGGGQAGAAAPTLAMSALAWASRVLGNGAIPAGRSF